MLKKLYYSHCSGLLVEKSRVIFLLVCLLEFPLLSPWIAFIKDERVILLKITCVR